MTESAAGDHGEFLILTKIDVTFYQLLVCFLLLCMNVNCYFIT